MIHFVQFVDFLKVIVNVENKSGKMTQSKEKIFCSKHQCYHNIFPKYSSCIKSKTMIKETSTMNKSNHTIGCDLESYAQTLRFRNNEKEADELDRIASRLK